LWSAGGRGPALRDRSSSAATSRYPPGNRPEPESTLSLLRVRLQPRARRDEIAGERAGAVLVRVTAPPVDGKANDALRRLVAGAAGVAPSKVTIVRGHTSRDKVLEVEGVDARELRAALGL
jgi:uncharacterized protein